MYDATSDDAIITKTLNGFRTCAQIAAHYSLTEMFDNIVVSVSVPVYLYFYLSSFSCIILYLYLYLVICL